MARILIAITLVCVSAPPLFLALLIWNWDAQGSPMVFVIAAAYFPLVLLPLTICFAVSFVEEKGSASKRMLRRGSLGAFVLCAALTGWALTLSTPAQRKEPSGKYRLGTPYSPRAPLQ